MAFPACRVSALVSPRTRELVEGQPFLRETYTWDQNTSVGPLIGWLRDRNFDAGVLFYPRPRLAWALVRAGIPVRAGTARSLREGVGRPGAACMRLGSRSRPGQGFRRRGSAARRPRRRTHQRS